MTRDEIIKMALEVGTPYVDRHYPGVTSFEFTEDALQRFVFAVAAAEREACAKVTEEESGRWAVPVTSADYREIWAECAAAIRARGAA